MGQNVLKGSNLGVDLKQRAAWDTIGLAGGSGLPNRWEEEVVDGTQGGRWGKSGLSQRALFMMAPTRDAALLSFLLLLIVATSARAQPR